MALRNDDDDDEKTDIDERELPDASDMDDDDDPAVVPCPYCRKTISEDAEWCPHCGQYISREDAPMSPRWWIVMVTIILLGVTLVGWFVFGR